MKNIDSEERASRGGSWYYENEDRAYRGGSWYYDSGLCRASYRDGVEPGYRNVNIGFRVVHRGKP